MADSPETNGTKLAVESGRKSALAMGFGILNLAIAIVGIIGAGILWDQWFGAGSTGNAASDIVRNNPSVRYWLLLVAVLSGASIVALLFAGWGMVRLKHWGFKVSLYYAACAMGALFLGLVVVLSHFRAGVKVHSGDSDVVFKIGISRPFNKDVTVDYATSDGTATAGSDYNAVKGSVTIPAGRLNQRVTVLVHGDAEDENNEDFTFSISNPVNAAVSNGVATCSIEDDDGMPSLKIGNVRALERSRNQSKAGFKVITSRSLPDRNITVRYATVDGTATGGADFVPVTGTLTIPAGSTNETINVMVVGDALEEGESEEFGVVLSDPANATIENASATCTIVDDDGEPSIRVSDYRLFEKDSRTKNAKLKITLSHRVKSEVRVDYATADGTATAGPDYVSKSGTVLFKPGQTSVVVRVAVVGDKEDDGITEDFFLRLTNSIGASIYDAEGVCTNVDNDGPPQLTLGDAPTVAERDGGRTKAIFPVSLSHRSVTDVVINYGSSNVTAEAGLDFTNAVGVCTITSGHTNGNIVVTVLGDKEPEGAAEIFAMVLKDVKGAQVVRGEALCVIADDDDTPTLSVKDVKLAEGSRADDPVVVGMSAVRKIGIYSAAWFGFIYPVIVLVFLSRRKLLGVFHVDAANTTYEVGTLRYTIIGLTALFAWLLWGDFCFMLMEGVVPSVLPLKLKSLGASNTLMSIILTTLPSILNMIVNPWISFKSDRHRGRWGRRIPFIVWTMPFLCVMLVMLGWSDEISAWVRLAMPALQTVAPATVTVTLIAGLMIAFQFFNMFVNSVFWYLFNDVVPAQFLGRFMGLFRVVTVAATALYQGFIFQFAETHMREIFTGGALLYFVGFGLMCLKVREGQYPPPPENTDKRKGIFSDIKTYGKESFSEKFYWYFYMYSAVGRLTGALGMFGIFFSLQMGLTLGQMGKLGMVAGIASLIATYFTATLVDKWHPLRIIAYEKVFTMLTGFGGWVWLCMTLPGDIYFWTGLAGTIVYTFNSTLSDAASYPLFMRILPKSRYGQLSSANALIRSIATILAGLLGGVFMDFLKWTCDGSDFAYRLTFTWAWPMSVISGVFLILGYQEWKRLGGDVHYSPPAPWSPTGREEVIDKVKSSPSRPRAIMLALWLTVAASVLNIILVGVFMIYMNRHDMIAAVRWHGTVFIPVKLLLTGLMIWQVFSVKRDVRDVEARRKPRFGVPHHGVFLVLAVTNLLSFPVYWLQTIWMIKVDLERELIIFGINGLLMALTGIVALQLIRWIERQECVVPAHLKESSSGQPAKAGA